MMAGSRLQMVCTDLRLCPRSACPGGYALRWYQPGDENDWLSIHRCADLYNCFSHELFLSEFGERTDELARRQCFLIAPSGETVGTATAWFGSGEEHCCGRIHWVAVKPHYQGRGLARPLLSAVCERLLELGYREAYLVTATSRIPAINLYFRFGFRPDLSGDGLQVWRKFLCQPENAATRKLPELVLYLQRELENC